MSRKTVSRRSKKNKTQKRRNGGGLWEIFFGPTQPAAAPAPAPAAAADSQAAAAQAAAPAAAPAPVVPVAAAAPVTSTSLGQQEPDAAQQPNVAVMGGKHNAKKSKSSKKSQKSKK